MAEWSNTIPCYPLSKIRVGIPFKSVCLNHANVFFFNSFIFVSVLFKGLDLKLVANAAISFTLLKDTVWNLGF